MVKSTDAGKMSDSSATPQKTGRAKPPTAPKPSLPKSCSAPVSIQRVWKPASHISSKPDRLNVKGKSESVAMVTSPNASSKQMIKSENDTRGSQKSQVKVPPAVPSKPSVAKTSKCSNNAMRIYRRDGSVEEKPITNNDRNGSAKPQADRKILKQSGDAPVVSVASDDVQNRQQISRKNATDKTTESERSLSRSPKVPPKPRIIHKSRESKNQQYTTDPKNKLNLRDENTAKFFTSDQADTQPTNSVCLADDKQKLPDSNQNQPVKPPREKKFRKLLDQTSVESSGNSSASDTDAASNMPARVSRSSKTSSAPMPVPMPRKSKLSKSAESRLDGWSAFPISTECSKSSKSHSLGSLLDAEPPGGKIIPAVSSLKSQPQNAKSHSQGCLTDIRNKFSVKTDKEMAHSSLNKETFSSKRKVLPQTPVKPTKNQASTQPMTPSIPAHSNKTDNDLSFSTDVSTNSSDDSAGKDFAIRLRTRAGTEQPSASMESSPGHNKVRSMHRRTWSYERALDDDPSGNATPCYKPCLRKCQSVGAVLEFDAWHKALSNLSNSCQRRLSQSLNSIAADLRSAPLIPASSSELFDNFLQHISSKSDQRSNEVQNTSDHKRVTQSVSVSNELQDKSDHKHVTQSVRAEIQESCQQTEALAAHVNTQDAIYYNQQSDDIYVNEAPASVQRRPKPMRVAPPPPPGVAPKTAANRLSSRYDEENYLKPKKGEASRVSLQEYDDVSNSAEDKVTMQATQRVDRNREGSNVYESVWSGSYSPICDSQTNSICSGSYEQTNSICSGSYEQVRDSQCPFEFEYDEFKTTSTSSNIALNRDGSNGYRKRWTRESSPDSNDYIPPQSVMTPPGGNAADEDLYMIHGEPASDSDDSSPHDYIDMKGSPVSSAGNDFSSSPFGSEYCISESEDGDAESPFVDKSEQKAFLVAKEIMTSEQTFVDVLTLLNNDFRREVDQMTAIHDRPIIPSSVLNQILNHLPQLQVFNNDLLSDLEARIWNWKKEPRICDIFVKKGAFLKLYTNYIQDFEAATSQLQEACRKYPVFSTVVRDFEGSARCARLELKHYMLKPVQRIPQYKLLLQDYLTHLKPTSLDYVDARKALNIVTSVANHANEHMQQGDNVKRLLEIQSSLIGQCELVRPGRVLLKEGELMKLSRKVLQPRYFVLLNDVLLYTTPVSAGYKLNNALPLAGMRVKKPKREDFQNEFSILSTQRSFTLCATTSEERDSWLKAISSAVSDNLKRRSSFGPEKAKKLGLVLFDKDAELGSKAPVWIHDARVTMCMLCNAEFTFTFRRHHCRACGKVVCGFCSDFKAPLKYRKFKSERVCEPCFGKLSTEFENINEDEIIKNASSEDIRLANESDETVPEMRAFIRKRFQVSRSSFRIDRRKPSVLKEVQANDEDAEMSGHLRMVQRKAWRKMWFVVKQKVLYTFKASEDTAAVESKPLLGFKVVTFTKLPPVPWYEGIEAGLVFSLEHQGTEPLYLGTESPAATDKWVAIMEKSVVP